MEKDEKFVLVQWIEDRGFSWSVLPRQDVYLTGTGERLRRGAIVKAKWRSSRPKAKVLAWDGKCVKRARQFNMPCVCSDTLQTG